MRRSWQQSSAVPVPLVWVGVKADPLGGDLHPCPQASFYCCLTLALRCFDDAVDAGLVLGAQLGVDLLDGLRAVDQLLQTGVELVVEGRGGPVGVEADAVSLGEDVEVVNQQLAGGGR